MAKRKAKLLKIGQFAKAMGVSEDFIKFYHKSGILEPQVDPENGYRSFNVWQGNRVVMAKCYRKMGFSIPEIQRLMSRSDSDEIIQKMAEKEKELDREIRKLLNLRMCMSDWKTSCERCYEGVNSWEIGSRPGYYMIDYMEGPEFLMGKEQQELLEMWMSSNYLTTRILWTFADEQAEQREEIIRGSVSIQEGWLDMPPCSPYIRYVPPCRKCFIYNYVEEWWPGRAHEMLHKAMEEMRKAGYEAEGVVLMINVLEAYKEGKRYMSYRIEIPIKASN